MNRTTLIHTEAITIRTLMVIMAVIAFTTGLSLLTSPLAVPFVVAIWISAAAMAALGILGRLPSHEE